MIHEYLQRGVAAGAVAGLAYGLYVAIVANPLSEYVDGAAHGHGHEHADSLVSETTTALVSAGSGVLWAIFLGGVFAVALYLFEPALPGRGDTKAYVLAAAGFLTVSVVPWTVFPPAAPGAEHAYGIDLRIGLYVGLVVLGAITVAAAVFAYNRGVQRGVGFGLAAGAVPILVVAGGLTIAAPTVTTHPGLSTDLVTAYQGLAVLSQAGLWLLIAAAFVGFRRRGTTRSENGSRRIEGALSD